MSRIAMFGGTFNPPHSGHVAAACACVSQLGLDKLLLVPTAVPPHKQLPTLTATSAQRLEMAELAASLIPNAEASDIELARGGASYTRITLDALRERYPSDELWLIMGTDMLESFHNWREPEGICSLARLVVCARDEGDRQRIEQAALRLERDFGARVDIIDNVPRPMSSTQAREGVARKLPDCISEYIREHCLYMDMDALREQVRGVLGERRFAHTMGCEKLAVQLARKYGADETVVRASALLHDITKELSLAQQLRLCEKWSIIHDYDGDNLEAVIHADTGAEAAVREYGMGETVRSAVKKHTVGDINMSLTDNIIYIADACEETRSYRGAREMRELALRDLNAAVISNMEQTIKRLENLGKKPYYKTERALAALIKEKEGKKINE